MIKSFADGRTRPFEDLLAALDAATSLGDLSPLKSIGLHKLAGDRAGQWAMTIT